MNGKKTVTGEYECKWISGCISVHYVLAPIVATHRPRGLGISGRMNQEAGICFR